MRTRILKIFALPSLAFLLLTGCGKESACCDLTRLEGMWQSVDALIDGVSDPDQKRTLYIFGEDGSVIYQIFDASDNPIVNQTATYTCSGGKLVIENKAMRMDADVVTLNQDHLTLRTKDVYGRTREDILERVI